MTPTSFTAFTDASSLVIFDPASGFEATEEWLNCLNHVADPDGQTNITCDYPEGAWPEVWKKNAERLRELSESGEFALLLCDSIDYACLVTGEITEADGSLLKSQFEERVYTPSGTLVFGDPMDAFSGDRMEESGFATVTVTPGWNRIRICHLSEPDAVPHIEGFEGDEEHPAVLFVVTPCDERPTNDAKSMMFPRIHSHYERAPNALCEAEVMSFDAQVVKLRLKHSRTVFLGFGHASVPASVQLEMGDVVLVRLLEERQAYWLVELD